MPQLSRRRTLLAGLGLPAGLALPGMARAQSWPNGPIRIIVPFAPGGSVDTTARLVQPSLQASLGVPVVVENRSGAAGAIGAREVARATPDGQSWGLVFDSHATMNALNPKAGFDALRDFTPVMLMSTSPMLLTAAPGRSWPDLAALAAAAKARPETITYGTVGAGSLAHLLMELWQQQGGFRLTHVPYRGGGPMVAGAVAGEIDLAIASRGGLGGQVGDKLRPLAQSGPTRSPALPALPTFVESGFPGVAALAFWAMLGPAGVPAPILARFHAALATALAEPGIRQRLVEGQGVDIVASSPAELGSFLAAQAEEWGKVIRERHITLD
ncbi:tripartite tricarboxylate transporter substrate binding protein [Siccirubricoccus sp. KC 17139]|uniref:Tripartite tricarboxylate transporter substrate binding protein n=1 Tax=Siccirubricoccus soli TaxID=2899147 RepID=A0ABT1D2J4_9PROT|nr:tripartite tricarboxylate transporter substrate-binding protein [Siccirubricoccus soli]MCO6415510.1 tripartite tricarboxylate transporter substrate binding protein [Siccirubricoccus soli]MCP2681642.1 tripartite tricarboxylate transporter substrate-binding protein [Siccirubricoccus soli]